MRFVIFCASVFALLGGFGHAEGTAAVDEILHPPHDVRFRGPVAPTGELAFDGYHVLRNSCEELGGYRVAANGDDLVLESFLRIDRDAVCVEVFRGNVPREYRVPGLVPGRAYRVLFTTADGGLVDFGRSPADPASPSGFAD